MKRWKIRTFFALTLLGAAMAVPDQKPAPASLKDLPGRYRDWLEKEVVYIISARERAVFLQLQSDRERDIFIEAFWKQRDTTPGTPANEVKEEHYQRIAYANEYYSRDTTQPGWMTDRGRIHILLGPPLDISRFEGESYVHPTLIWSYAGRPEYGFPTQFNIVFFRRDGAGEYVLYSPTQDGPFSLLVNYRGDPTSASEAYQQLRKFNPRLAEVSLSLIPEEGLPLGQPSLASDRLIGQVLGLPEKAVDSRYAVALLKFKDIVEVEYTANYIDSTNIVSVIQDGSGPFFVHYAIQPGKMSVLSHDGKYSVNFAINGIFTGPDGRVIFQFDKSFPLDFDGSQIQDVQKTGVIVEDAIPIATGTYMFSLVLKNTVSKEFASFEKQITVPRAGGADFGISPLLLGYQAKPIPPGLRQVKPFRVGGTQLSCQPGQTFAPTESLAVCFQVFGLPEELRRTGRVEYLFERRGQEFLRTAIPLKDLPAKDIVREFLLRAFPPDFYKLRVTLRDGRDRAAVSTEAEFGVSTQAEIPRPWVIAKVMPPADHEMYAYLLGGQLVKSGEVDAGGKLLAKAFTANPKMLDYALAFAEWLAQRKEYTKAKDILGPFSGSSEKRPEALALLGACCQSLGQYREAIVHYKTYLSLVGTNLEVLNSLGQCSYELGDFEEAKIAWEKSLEINPRQDRVRELLDKARKKRTP